MIFYILGKMMGVEGIVLLIPAFVSLLYQEKSGFSFLIVSAVLILIYFVLGRKEPKSKRIYSKEGFAIVGLAWLLWSAFGALPFVISGSIPHYIDAFFETVSGFTTTGSTILTEIEILPKGIAFWRSFTHWIGGMGVLVFVMMITSLDDDNAMPLMRAEVPGPEADKLVPKARRTAKILYGMYFALTAVETVFLMAGGMSFFDALLHAFSTAGTGGFSNKNASVGFFDSAYIDGVITVFMILFGINFNLYFLFLLKEWKTALKNEELWVYLGIIGASMAAITGNILHIYGNIFRAFRYASFQVASVITTTGFCTADYDRWPEPVEDDPDVAHVRGSMCKFYRGRDQGESSDYPVEVCPSGSTKNPASECGDSDPGQWKEDRSGYAEKCKYLSGVLCVDPGCINAACIH